MSCNQNCNHGRSCDCVPNLVDNEEASIGEGAGVIVWPLICLSAVAVWALVAYVSL